VRIERQSETHEVLRREVAKEKPHGEVKKGPGPGGVPAESAPAADDVRVSIALENRLAAASTLEGLKEARGVVSNVARGVQSGSGKVIKAQANLRPENVLHLLR